ncbi:hypothetical protein F0H82_11020 [Escherichia coli]|nr:hypothetical protein [Escherichia coli]EFD5322534.1 hypothetical protein [Escherichia coli]EFD7746742.1 hypothetical protein [Escherichia coli]EFN7831877.1 hypothetical protein [Escherichia coli]OJQ78154.1 hypothetical protein BK369_25135 [Escherichia coli]
MFAGKKSAQIREILISESAWEEMTCLFAPSLVVITKIAFMLFKHCFYIFNNVSFYPSLLSFPEIRKK